MVNFSTTQGLAMPIKKYLILSLLSFVIYSCANDSSSGPSPTLINGQWNSDQYLYSPNCGQQNLSFDDYISYLVIELQQYSAQTQVDIICNGQPEGWCESPTAGDTYDTNADSVYAIQLSFVVNQWDNDSTLTEMLIAENMIISDVSDIQLNINNDNTYTISWDGVCIDYPEFTEEQCNELSSGTWNGDSCEFLTEDGCESSFVNGTWDDGSSGVLDGDSDLYTMDDVDDDSVFEGNELNFDGSSISITVISTPELCVSLNFTK
tara:strand:+ start:113 stop:904 length:792 start_codon:yes stop_codon:yes gene_type:complete